MISSDTWRESEEMNTEEKDLLLLGEICKNEEHHELIQRLICRAEDRGAKRERVACVHIADEMQRMAENPHNRSATNQRHNMRLRSEARMAKSIKEKIIDRTPFSQRTPELITGK